VKWRVTVGQPDVKNPSKEPQARTFFEYFNQAKKIGYVKMIFGVHVQGGTTMKFARLKVHRSEEWEKMVQEAAAEAYDLLNSDKRRA
jgi:hypothetical protein